MSDGCLPVYISTAIYKKRAALAEMCKSVLLL